MSNTFDTLQIEEFISTLECVIGQKIDFVDSLTVSDLKQFKEQISALSEASNLDKNIRKITIVKGITNKIRQLYIELSQKRPPDLYPRDLRIPTYSG